MIESIFTGREKIPYRELSPIGLAFIGDAIWEVYARNYVIMHGVRRPHEMHEATKGFVRATSQAKLASWLEDKLNDDEKDFLRRGRNAKSAHVRKNADVLEYRHSTGFEALIGYLYCSGHAERLQEISQMALNWLWDTSRG